MNKKTKPFNLKTYVLSVMTIFVFISTNAFTKTNTYLQVTNTPTPTSVPLFICNNNIPGFTCQNFGSHMRYDINLYQENNLINTDWLPIEITSAMISQDVYIFYNLTYTFTNPSVIYSGWDRQIIFATLYGVQPDPFNYWAPSQSGVYTNSGMVVQNFYGTPGIFKLSAVGQWSEDTAIQGSITFSSIPILPTATPTPTSTASATPTPSSYNLILQPDAANGIDTILSSAAPTTNYGTSTSFAVGEDNNATNKIARSLIKFDLSSIPPNATITSATLSLWTLSDLSSNTRNINVYRLKRPFTESQATWNIAQTGVNWQTAGASGTNDRETTSLGLVSIPANQALNTEKQITLNVTKIQEMIDGTFTNNGFIVIADTELNDRFNYKSSDHATIAHRPKLVISYSVPFMTPTPTVTMTPTITSTPTATNTPMAGIYNRNAAVNYADTWAHSRNINYPNYGTDNDSVCNDCTNYLSQILEAGGIPQIPGADDELHWYHFINNNLNISSGSWAATDLFNFHVSQFQGIRYEYYPNGPSTLSQGDFFVMNLLTNPFSGPDHARIIMGMGVVLEGDTIGQTLLLANQHCTDRQRVRWDYNIPGGTQVWAWHVVY